MEQSKVSSKITSMEELYNSYEKKKIYISQDISEVVALLDKWFKATDSIRIE